ncbi:hypothetical protein REPUB_Repub16aG0106100 [Reevesia pubescens]
MAEAIVSSILEQLKTITIEKASEDWKLVKGVEKEAARLESNFMAIQYELEDAEEKQYSDKRLKHWLQRFKQVSYDMEDVLDDWKTAIQKLRTADEAETSTTTFVPTYWKVCEDGGSCNNIPTTSIVGMGGIGKTALAQLIYNDHTIQTHFNNRVWVSVSEPFDQTQIARAILGDRAQDWEPLKATFQYGMPGSWILVTTRNESVATQMDLSHVFHLSLLSEKIYWLILDQIAFAGRNRDRRQVLEDIGWEIAKKCKGLPLAAKTLGGLLQHKPRREEWLNVLNSYLNSDDNFGRELKGEDYFNCLASRSFFQDFEKDDDGTISYCKMHDFVHDFVQFLSKGEFLIEEADSVENLTLDLSSKNARHLRLGFANKSYFPESIYGAEKFRSIIAVTHEWRTSIATSEAWQNLFSRSKRLRLLDFDSFDLQAKEIPHGIGNLIHLRYLSLIFCYGIENLPEAVCELLNLQSLNLRYCCNLKNLPVGIGKLINLRYLCIKGCWDLTCAKAICNLTSLKRLSIKMRADRNDADEFSIRDLEKLDLLGGNLYVELIGNGIDWDEAKRAKLHNKIHLKGMVINICSPSIKEEEPFN